MNRSRITAHLVALCLVLLGTDAAFRVKTDISINNEAGAPSLRHKGVRGAGLDTTDPVHVVSFDTPSYSSAGSMPTGNGDLAANVWVRPSDDGVVMSLLVSKSDAWSGNTRLLKVALVEVTVSGVPMEAMAGQYSESLDVRTGAITVASGSVTIKAWAAAEGNVLRVAVDAPVQAKASAQLYPWRTEGSIPSDSPSVRGVCGDSVREDADIVEDGPPNGAIRVYHSNSWSYYPESLERQGLGAFKEGTDPLLNRTFGCDVTSDVMKAVNSTRLESGAGAGGGGIEVMIVCETAMSVDDWRTKMQQGYDHAHPISPEESLERTASGWQAAFAHTYVDLEGALSPSQRNVTRTTVSRGYNLQRFMELASGASSETPLKFNGMLFSVNTTSEDYDARMWGGGFWFQNTRQMYWAALASGDLALMKTWFANYERWLPLAEYRNKQYFGHAGSFFPETMFLWGVYEDSDYGCDRTNLPSWFIENSFIRHHINGGLELITMMLEYFKYTQDTAFAKGTLARLATSLLTHYRLHWPLDIYGRIRLVSSALETYQNAINPTPDVAGLNYIVSAFHSDVPAELIPDALKSVLAYIEAHMPALPLSSDGRRIAPAEAHDAKAENSENVELYAAWPFKLVSLTADVNMTLLDLGRSTYDTRQFPCNDGWCQDVVDAALLALPQEAAGQLVGRFNRAAAAGMRFPGFYGPMQDSTPAADHGATARIALQWMLMQTDGDRIILFPSWPSEWGNVTFKLYAPKNTLVEVKCRNGQLAELNVAPAARMSDVVMPFGPCGQSRD